jgi:hypothetical protein
MLGGIEREQENDAVALCRGAAAFSRFRVDVARAMRTESRRDALRLSSSVSRLSNHRTLVPDTRVSVSAAGWSCSRPGGFVFRRSPGFARTGGEIDHS